MDRPLRATRHCRHYSYERGAGWADKSSGPRCARGVDLSSPGSAMMCMPGDDPRPRAGCSQREEYTDEERKAWRAYVDWGLTKLSCALDVFEPVACGTETRKPCPHCDGVLVLQRMSNGHAWLTCTTDGCVGPVHFNVDRKAEWPAPSHAGEAAQ